MNKKEKERLEWLEKQLAKTKAFRFTNKVIADVPIPEGSRDLSKGFLFHAPSSYSPRVEVACSSAIYHAFGSNEKTSSQGSKRLFSKASLAWKAVRNTLEEDYAVRLADIDIIIEGLEGEGK